MAKPFTSNEPSIRYRGIFINDEAPALTGWVRDKFGGYNVQFYKKVFELLLRLKANFLWPAMWPGWPNPGASFFNDDPENQKTADAWGIVMSTSHHEPMQRLSNEWVAQHLLGTWDWITNKEKITKFFAEGVERARGYESYFTLGMRGEYDTKMPTEDPAGVVKEVLKTQRRLIKDVYGREDAVPQLLALYKEVQKQYESGRLEVPDDVTLLFSDDNFGTIRRLPYGDEVKRKGGAGLYYHLEYVGTPRSYKWINSNSMHRIHHQLREAHRRHARQIWVFNVGDIKPLEVPLTFAMALAWDIGCVDQSEEGVGLFLEELAERMFGAEHGDLVSQVWKEYDKMVSLRRHEHIEPTTFSLLHYNEAEDILLNWADTVVQAEVAYKNVDYNMRPALFQLVLYPAQASANFVSLQINLGRNRLYARQRRNSTNYYANEVHRMFNIDFDLTEQYHSLLDGKWNHIMGQPHFGFEESTWHAPSRDMISGLCYVQIRQDSNPIVGPMGVAVEGQAGVRPGLINENSDFTHPSRGDLVTGLTLGLMTRYGPQQRWFDLFMRGTSAVHWTITALYPWLQLSHRQGVLGHAECDRRVTVEIVWEIVPDDLEEEALIRIESEEGAYEFVHLPIVGRKAPPGTEGYIEADGLICIRAEDHLREVAPPSSSDERRDLAHIAVGGLPTPMSDTTFFYGELLHRQLECGIYLFSDASRPENQARMLLYFHMTLDYDPTDPMTYEISFDQGPATRYRLLEDDDFEDPELPSPRGWLKAVQDCMWIKEHNLRPFQLGPGGHNLQLRLLHSNMVLEKVVFDFGGLKEGSYRGPLPRGHDPASARLPLGSEMEGLETSR